MDLLSNMNDKFWSGGSPDKIDGLIEYTILKSKLLEPGKFEFALKVYAPEESSDDVKMIIGVMDGCQGKRNPLGQTRNAQFKIENGKVTAVNLDGDCVVHK